MPQQEQPTTLRDRIGNKELSDQHGIYQIDGSEYNVDEDLLVSFIESECVATENIARQNERDRILELIDKREIEIVGNAKGYDGNDIRSASKHYNIAAESWAEIIRYEDGYNNALSDLKTDITKEI